MNCSATTTTATGLGYCIDDCNCLLRSEISVVETYDQAIAKFDDSRVTHALKEIRDGHARSIASLREFVMSMGGHPSEDPGAREECAEPVKRAAPLRGKNAAISLLLAGEEEVEKEYRRALADGYLTPAGRELVRSELLPRIPRHALALEAMKAAV